MAIELTTRTKLLSEQNNLVQQIILKIDGITEIFGAQPITEIVKVGAPGLLVGGFVVGDLVELEESRPWVMLPGTTNSITQQLEDDNANVNSISRMNIKLVDKDRTLSSIFSPGVRVDDLLSREADVYVTFEGAVWPEDAVKIFTGLVSQLKVGSGNATVSISHPDTLKKQDVYTLFNGKLSSGIGSVDTTIPMDTVNGFIESSGVLTSYIKISDEIIEVGSISGSSFIDCVRSSLGTSPDNHSLDDDVESFYRLQGNIMDVALKTMLSNGGDAFETDISAERFVQLTGSLNVPNAIFFEGDIEKDLGIISGDTLTTTGAVSGANNVTDAVISNITKIEEGSYIVLAGVSLVSETGSSAVASFKSQYNTLPVGAGLEMTPKQVAVSEHLSVSNLSLGGSPDVDLYIKDTIKGKDLLNELFFAVGIFQIPRGGKASINSTLPPLALTGTKTVGDAHVLNPQSIQITRGVDKNFYNAIVYRFEEKASEDKLLASEIRQSADSTNRIKIGNRVLTIDAKAFRDNPTTRTFFQTAARNLLRKFQYGAETFEAEVNYKTGFNMDVGDSVVFDTTNLFIYNSISASRNAVSSVYVIQNKSMDVKTGKIKLSLINSIFGTSFRYGVIGPSSKIGPSATTTTIPIKRSYVADASLGDESDKWDRYINSNVRIHSEDFTFDETVQFLGFLSGTDNVMQTTALSGAPSEDYIVDMPSYQSASSIYKSVNVFAQKRVLVTSGASSTAFDVAVGDVSRFIEDNIIRIHSTDFSNDSTNVKITNVTGTTVTVEDMGFTPSASDEIDLAVFPSDNGSSYVYF